MPILNYYSLNAFDETKTAALLKSLQEVNNYISDVKTEKCYYIEINDEGNLSEHNETALKWILRRPEKNCNLIRSSSLKEKSNHDVIIEIGPRFNFSTPDSTNSVSICQNFNLDVKRFEVSIKYLISFDHPSSTSIPQNIIDHLIEFLSDRMTQCRYTTNNIPLNSFYEDLKPAKCSWDTIPILKNGKSALVAANKKFGLAFDEWDLEYYTNLFVNVLKRDPTSVEMFDLSQSNSEHSRHWFFKGKMIIDDIPKDKSLIQMIIDTQKHSNQNNTIKFSDNSSAIKGFKHQALCSKDVTGPSQMFIKDVESDLIFTAETHNMPTAVSPFSGATTGTGGRIRDVQAVGRGGLTIAGTAGYCVGNLNIPSFNLSYESSTLEYPPSFASPLKIIIEASDGASDYGNKFGEPLISGFAISYGLLNSMNERDEYIKPIMFSGGLGIMNAKHTNKIEPKKGMLLAKIGGPVYRIGVGGGAASSVEVQGDNSSELDFNAVQRGDAEMENKLNRVVRACIELADDNPIIAIHDQGAGGNGNVLKELVEPGYAGAVVFSKEFKLGDPTITLLELWAAEYQENNAILCKSDDKKLLEDICNRERCPISFVGVVTGDGFVSLIEEDADFEKYQNRDAINSLDKQLPFYMNLKDVLGEMPRKEYQLKRIPQTFSPLDLPPTWDYNNFLFKVLSVLSVGSKRFLTNKVDRCVTGLVAQQQCVGPLHTPLADFALTAISYFGFEGIATSIGTQPLKGLISAKAGARMSVAEAISNLVFAGITTLSDVKCSGNWMWAAKLPGEGAKLYDACEEMCEIMKELTIAIDGGKDSLSMAARVKGETVKSPGTLVISTYAPCPDVRVKVTPDLKSPAINKEGQLVWINIEGVFRLGGSVLAQTFGQQGDDCPTLNKTEILKKAFNVTQKLIKSNMVLSGHDISDGGLIVCILEMAFAGLCGLEIDLESVVKATKLGADATALLFSEEIGWIIEVESKNLLKVLKAFEEDSVPAYHIGCSQGKGFLSQIKISCGERVLIKNTSLALFKQWERLSFEIEKLQMNPDMAIEEYSTYNNRTGPKYNCNFNPDESIIKTAKLFSSPIRVAVIREEGINGDREMIATLIKSNFDVYDVTMVDLINKKTTLDQYRGIIFPGGFSYADTLGSAKGWAASIIFNEIQAQFIEFKKRANTFSLGVCNGCQLMSQIGYLEDGTQNNHSNIALVENKSERYECRWTTVKIPKNKSIMLRNMVDTTVGCWVAHGEGRFLFNDSSILKKLQDNECIAMNYVDDGGKPTEAYPMNPNGSPNGIAGICSEDGRHLAIMPHPERCSIMWQWPYVPASFNYKTSPWQRMFDEAYIWCTEN